MNKDINNVYKPNESLSSMAVRNFTWGVYGLILGILVDKTTRVLIKQLNITNQHVQIFLQLILCSIVLALIHTKLNNKFGWDWQNVTPGLFFTGFFFEVQFITTLNMQNMYAL